MKGWRSIATAGLLFVGLATAASGQGTWSRAAPLPSRPHRSRRRGSRPPLRDRRRPGRRSGRGVRPRGSLSAGPPLPVPIHHTAAVGDQRARWTVGGCRGGQWAVLDSVFEYDPATDRWRPRAPLPTARGALAAAVIDGRIYAAGGVDATRRNSDALEVYDPGRDRWEPRAPMPVPRDHLGAAAVGGKLHVIGGRLDGSYARNLDAHHVYDPVTNRWTAAPPLPTARSGIAAAVLGSRLFVFGGEAPTGTFGQVEVYDLTVSRWSALAPMPTPRHGLTAIAFEGRIHVLSGGPQPGGSFSAAHEVLSP